GGSGGRARGRRRGRTRSPAAPLPSCGAPRRPGSALFRPRPTARRRRRRAGRRAPSRRRAYERPGRAPSCPRRSLSGAPKGSCRGRCYYTAPRVNWDDAAIQRWLEPLLGKGTEIAEVFGEELAELALDWVDGEIREVRVRREEGVAARRRAGGEERLVFVSGG